MIYFLYIILQGQTFVALDPNCFAPGFEEQMQTFMDEMRQMDPVRTVFKDVNRSFYVIVVYMIPVLYYWMCSSIKSDPSLPVKVAGDLSRSRMHKADENGGILYHENMISSLVSLYA